MRNGADDYYDGRLTRECVTQFITGIRLLIFHQPPMTHQPLINHNDLYLGNRVINLIPTWEQRWKLKVKRDDIKLRLGNYFQLNHKYFLGRRTNPFVDNKAQKNSIHCIVLYSME